MYISWTETNEYSYEADLPTAAKTLGIRVTKLKRIMDGDEELDMSELTSVAKTLHRDQADHASEELTCDEVTEA